MERIKLCKLSIPFIEKALFQNVSPKVYIINIDDHKIINIFYPSLLTCFGWEKELSQKFWLRNKKLTFLVHTLK